MELRLDDDSLIILDAGTGIRPLGNSLMEELPMTIHLLLTHLHLDHLEGLGFFGPLWSPDVDLHIWGPPSPLRSLERRIARYLSPPLFPIHLQDIPSRPTFHDVPDDEWKIGAAKIAARPVSHRGPTVGYRVQENGHSLAYIPDHEPALGVDMRSVDAEWISGHAVAQAADILLHDAQYTEEEYPSRIGWGHSSTEHVVTFATICEVRQLVMFHHDPMHTDDQLEAILRRALDMWDGGASDPILAHEGMELELT